MNRRNRIFFSALTLAVAASAGGVAWGQGAQGTVPGATPAQPQATTPTPSTGGGTTAGTQPSQANPLLSMKAGEIAGREIYNIQGRELGKVDMIGRDRTTGALSAIVSVGGFLGFGGSKVAIPIEQLSFQEDKLILSTAMSKKELRQQSPNYQSKRYEAVAEDTTLSQVAPSSMGSTAGITPPAQATQPQGQPPTAGAGATFEQLDSNRDGYISRNEAAQDPTVMSHWRQLDRNNDGRIDNSEFSAFEQSSTEPRPKGDDMRLRQ